jgi:hypothetical protein
MITLEINQQDKLKLLLKLQFSLVFLNLSTVMLLF